MSYYVRKKQGFPSITDMGVADIYMGGQGFSFKVKMATAEATDRQHFFKIEKIDVDVKGLNIKLKKSKFKLPFMLFKPILFRVIRPVIQKVLEKQIRASVTQADALCYSIHQEAQRSARASDPTSVQNFYQRYYQAAQKRLLQGKEKSKKAAEGRTVNVAVTAQDSIFPDIKLPGGISTKATEYRDLAAKGDKWESPIFSIGTAKESTNLPSLSPIQRRPHQTATGGIRGPQNVGNATSNFSSQVDQSFGTQQNLSLGQQQQQAGGVPRANGTLNGTSSDYPLSSGQGPSSGYATTTGGPGMSGTSTGTGVDPNYGTSGGVGATGINPVVSGGTLLGQSNPVLQGTA